MFFIDNFHKLCSLAHPMPFCLKSSCYQNVEYRLHDIGRRMAMDPDIKPWLLMYLKGRLSRKEIQAEEKFFASFFKHEVQPPLSLDQRIQVCTRLTYYYRELTVSKYVDKDSDMVINAIDYMHRLTVITPEDKEVLLMDDYLLDFITGRIPDRIGEVLHKDINCFMRSWYKDPLLFNFVGMLIFFGCFKWLKQRRALRCLYDRRCSDYIREFIFASFLDRECIMVNFTPYALRDRYEFDARDEYL